MELTMRKPNASLLVKSLPFTLLPFAIQAQATELDASLGVASSWQQSYVIGEDDDPKYLPYINVQYGLFVLNYDGLGITKKVGKADQFSALFNLRESTIDHGDNDVLSNLKKRDDATDLALLWTHNTSLVDFTGGVVFDVSDTHQGYEALLGLSKQYVTQKFGIFKPAATISYQSEDLVDYYYGVSTAEADAKIAAYEGDASVNAQLSFTHIYPINDNWHTATVVSYDYLGSGISDSPIVERDNYWTGALALFYKF